MRVLMRIIINPNFWGQGGIPCEIPFGSAKCSIELQHVSNMLDFVRESGCTIFDKIFCNLWRFSDIYNV